MSTKDIDKMLDWYIETYTLNQEVRRWWVYKTKRIWKLRRLLRLRQRGWEIVANTHGTPYEDLITDLMTDVICEINRWKKQLNLPD